MPHDRKGNILKEGDIVSIPARITSIQPGEEYCNVTLATIEPMPPYTDPYSITLNTRQVDLVATGQAGS
jgi:hypothetical protein